jgi:hypothetical protein
MAFFEDAKDRFSTIFGPGTDAPSYEALQRKRQVADALQAQLMGNQPKNWGEGVGGLMQALAYRMMDKSIGKQEGAERSRASEELAGIRGGMGPEGVTAEQLTALSEIVGNPYAEGGTEAIARALMRRNGRAAAGDGSAVRRTCHHERAEHAAAAGKRRPDGRDDAAGDAPGRGRAAAV